MSDTVNLHVGSIEEMGKRFVGAWCVFRATWTPIPGEAGHRFQSKLDSDST